MTKKAKWIGYVCPTCERPFLAAPYVPRVYCSVACHKLRLRDPERFANAFWAKVNKTATCWLWTASRNWAGYGLCLVGKNRKLTNAHRVSWEMANGKIKGGLHVLHKCDVRNCVRPDHLFLGTHRDNMLDMRAKGRAGNQRQATA